MKKWIKIILILAGTGIIAAILIFKFYVNKPHEDIEKAKAAFQISASELWKQYNSDLALSDSLYTGKVIEVTGKLSKTEKSDTLVYAIFVMEEDSLFGDKSIRCEMLQKYASEATGLPSGSDINIKGYCAGYDQTDIKLSKCSIIR
jgi:hypothetical protein